MKTPVDRVKGPAIVDIKEIDIPAVKHIDLANGLKLHIVNAGTQEIVKIEIVNLAGRAYESKKLSAKPTASLLKEGTQTKSSKDIAEHVDFYGASLITKSGMDTGSVSLYCLTKYLDQLLPQVLECVVDPIFSFDELETFKSLHAQNLKIELSKNDVKAYRFITDHIFGSDHVYGYNSDPEDYQKIERADLLKHYQKTYLTTDTEVFVAGKVDEHILKTIIRHLEQLPIKASIKQSYTQTVSKITGRHHYYSDTDHQTAIRIGSRAIPRTDSDFHGLFFTNTLLGGYFGSRLMREIRENKGYTYGIYSLIDAMKFDGSWMISTEVANEYVEKTINACKKEIDTLQNTQPDQNEIKMVRNYLMGHYMTMVDGPFKTAQLLKMLRISGLNFDYFKEFIEQTKRIDGKQVREIAKKYFPIDELITVTVGSN